MDLTKSVRKLRAVTGDSQQSFAARLGLSMRAVANYEKDRAPTGRGLYQLSKLARELGREDLADVFSSTLSEELGGAVEPLTAEEKAWCNAVVTLLRNKDHIDWAEIGSSLVRALEKLVGRRKESAGLEAVLLEARYRLADSAERELESLAKARQETTGESYDKAYAKVLLENPHLYERYLRERGEAARGTSFEKFMASPHMRKGAKPK
jgi:transcriptional regulator with XRE-family HTH domain